MDLYRMDLGKMYSIDCLCCRGKLRITYAIERPVLDEDLDQLKTYKKLARNKFKRRLKWKQLP